MAVSMKVYLSALSVSSHAPSQAGRGQARHSESCLVSRHGASLRRHTSLEPSPPAWLPPPQASARTEAAPQLRIQEPLALELAQRGACRDPDGRLMIKNLRRSELEEWCVAQGERPQRALQLWRWMYQGDMIACLDQSAHRTNGFSEGYRDAVRSELSLDGGLALERVHTAADGTRKLVFRLISGPAPGATVETVLIPIVRKGGERPRMTVCVSSQVGCAMNCQFCYTGRMGLKANLSTAQIVEQVVAARRLLAADAREGAGGAPATGGITNIVFMGMGEPLHNLPAVLAAVDILCDPLGLQLSHNKVTVSTVGLVPEVKQFCESSRSQLAVSLHATTDEVRDWIAPVNRRWNLEQLMGTLREYFPAASVRQPLTRAPSAGSYEEAAGSCGEAAIELDPAGSGGVYGKAREVSDTAMSAGSCGDTMMIPMVSQRTCDEPGNDHGVPATSATVAVLPDASMVAATVHMKELTSRDQEAERILGVAASDSADVSSEAAGSSRRRAGGFVLIEYVMLRGINDTKDDAYRLLSLLVGIQAKVNLIVFNPHEGTRFKPSHMPNVMAFRSILIQGGRVCTLRDSRGDDEMAACGQLGDPATSARAAPILAPPQRLRELVATGYRGT